MPSDWQRMPLCQVLTVHGSDDEVIPVDDSVDFSKMIPNHKLSAVLLIISVKGSWPLLCCLDFLGLYYTVHPSIAMTHAWLAARTVVMDGEYWIVSLRLWRHALPWLLYCCHLCNSWHSLWFPGCYYGYSENLADITIS